MGSGATYARRAVARGDVRDLQPARKESSRATGESVTEGFICFFEFLGVGVFVGGFSRYGT